MGALLLRGQMMPRSKNISVEEKVRALVRATSLELQALRLRASLSELPPRTKEFIRNGIIEAAELAGIEEPFENIRRKKNEPRANNDAAVAAWKFFHAAENDRLAKAVEALKVNLLRAQIHLDDARMFDAAAGISRRSKAGYVTKQRRQSERDERAAEARAHWDRLTSQAPRNRASIIATAMNISPTTVRSYIKKAKRR